MVGPVPFTARCPIRRRARRGETSRSPELDAAANKHGFMDSDYGEVTTNITAGVDPQTKAFTEPAIAIKEGPPTRTFRRRTKSRCWMS